MSSTIPSTYTGTVYDDSTTTATYASSEDTTLGQDAFLKMFMAQVTNQDPMNPMDNTEFTAQLATFSQLEQLQQINDSLANMDDLVTATKRNTAVGYLGNDVTAQGNLIPVVDGQAGKYTFKLANSANAEAVITDSSGKVVANVGLGALSAGNNSFTWDCTDNTGNTVADGAYTISVTAATSDGTEVEILDQTVTARVTGITTDEDGVTYLLMGEAALAADKAIAVSVPESGASSGDDDSTLEDSLEELEDLTAKAESGEETTLSDVLQALGSIGSIAALLL